jgi:dTMP kinase
MKGSYIIFEGLDGAGKTTLMNGVAENLAASGNVVFIMGGYGDKHLKESIQKELLRVQPDQKYLALLFAADRMKQMDIIREKQYQQDVVILSSRSYISSLVYQTAGTDISITWIETLNKFCIEPDLVVFCDVSVEEADRRIKSRKGEVDGFENIEFLSLVKKNYDAVLKGFNGKVFTVNMEEPINTCVENVSKFIKK